MIISEKIKSLDKVTSLLKVLKKEDKKIIHRYGVFDLLHIGHIKYFQEAKSMGDVFVAISSSGSSENILNGCRAAREKKFSKVITLSGMNSENPLREIGDINLWVNSKAYNHIESIHQFWLLAVVDMIIGKTEYSVNPGIS